MSVEVVSSTGKPATGKWPWIAEQLPDLVTPAPGGRRTGSAGDGATILDGEVIAYDDDGRHSFGLVGRADKRHALVLFDLLRLDGIDLAGRPWHERRELLEHRMRPGGAVSITPVSDDAELIEEATKAQRFEGVIAKRRESLYVPGSRSSAWVKVKWRFEQEFVVGGYKIGEGNRSGTFGSLLLGVYPERPTKRAGRGKGAPFVPAGPLRFVGGVGTGFDDKTLTAIKRQLRDLTVAERPFEQMPVLPGGKDRLRWVRPELVAQVSFGEWTDYAILRHPVFVGLRDDKDPADIIRET